MLQARTASPAPKKAAENSEVSDNESSNSEALGDHYREHRAELCRYAINKFGLVAAEAEDVVQLAFTRFTPQFEAVDIENVRAFLYRAVNNAAIDQLRRSRVRRSFAESVQGDPEREVDSIDPERIAVGRQLLGLISRALRNMPQKRRRLLLMNRVDGLSYAEIARQEGLSQTVVKKHVAKALAECQAELRANGGDL